MVQSLVMKQTETYRSLIQSYFLRPDNTYGCAETTYLVLKHLYGLRGPEDSSIAMVLNGGIAYTGGMCGAITGASLAVGQLAGQTLSDHALAKRKSRQVIVEVHKEFLAEFGTDSCKKLTGYDFSKPHEHDRFIEAMRWEAECTQQILFVVERLANLSF
jgi:C_GCAxxG_C_C family probable redox protein